MIGKNLPLKFAFLALMVATCLWSLHANGLKMGIDIHGGHSLVFEVRPEPGSDEPTHREAVSEVITILKRRIDPDGLAQLEWRPLGPGRFEVRMPFGRAETIEAKESYFRKLEDITADNIRRSDILRACRASGPQRAAEIARLAERAPQQVPALEAACQAYDALGNAQTTVDAARAQLGGANGNAVEPAQRVFDEAINALVTAKADYRAKKQAILDGNIDKQKLRVILSNYVSGRQAQAIAKRRDGKIEVKRRRQVLALELKKLRDAHPARAQQINDLEAIYSKWSEMRQPLEDPADLKRMIAKAGVLEFRIAPSQPGSPAQTGPISLNDYEQAIASLINDGPEGLRRKNAKHLWFKLKGSADDFGSGLVTGTYGGQDFVLLSNTSDLMILADRSVTGWKLDKAKVGFDQNGLPNIEFGLDEGGGRRMSRITGENIDKAMAILLDDEVYSAPNIRGRIATRGQIEGSFSREEAAELSRTLQAGSLPARVNSDPVSENNFGPSLGEMNKQRGIRAAYYGMVGVAVFMLTYYLLAGMIANAALVLNIILVLGAMSLMSAVFTLPGIAGVILTIGIAVDANVLIFERLREEQARGQSAQMALKNAYKRAFSAIFDANITTLITCLILAWIGTEEVRGFGITLGMGVAFSLFTSLVVTRWIFQALIGMRLLKRPVLMLKIMSVPNINWMSKRYYFWAVSALLMTMGITSLVWQGKDLLGIQFSAGTQATISLRDDALIDGELPNDGIVREMFVAAVTELSQTDSKFAKLAETASVVKQIDPDRTANFLGDYDSDDDGLVSRAEWDKLGLDGAFFEIIDTEIDGKLTREELNANLTERSYQVTTTEENLGLIRQATRQAFGVLLEQVSEREFSLAKGQMSDEFGVPLAGDGLTVIGSGEDLPYQDLFENNPGGVLMVIDKVVPPLTEAELSKRIRDMRLRPDFGSQQGEATVIGLTSAGREGYSKLAVVVSPADSSVTEDQDAWRRFAEGEKALLTASLARGEAMLATNFDKAIAGEAVGQAVFAIVLSWIAIVLYLWLRFGSVQWGLAAVICLIHDVIIVVGLLAATGWLHQTVFGKALLIDSFKIDLAMVAAILTVIGYSVNDTIVVFDRIRENRGHLTTVSGEIINASINQTLPRTLLTSFTTLIVVGIMYIWGGPGIHPFNFVLMAGIIFGTYSSVAVASPILMGFKGALVAKVVGSAPVSE